MHTFLEVKRMKKLFAMILAVLMVVSLAACGTTEEESSAPEAETSEEAVTSEGSEAEQESEAEYGPVLAKIKEAGKLVVGTEAQYAPFEFKDLDANYAGSRHVACQQIADSLGVELEIVDMAFDGIIPRSRPARSIWASRPLPKPTSAPKSSISRIFISRMSSF
jgi:polar amino acid transport system substrate-binding protein